MGKGKLYAEKIFMLYENQEVPFHYHWIKVEDVINRAGGDIGVQLYNSDKDDGLASTNIIASIDGVEVEIKAGKEFFLKSGESITLLPGVYHRFCCPKGKVLVGEVSLVNDDKNDNKSKNSYCSYLTDEDSQYDILIPNLKKINANTIALARKNKSKRLTQAAWQQAKDKGLKKIK